MKERKQQVLNFRDLRKQEKHIVNLIRAIGFGEVRISIQNGVPVRINGYKQSIKL